METITAESEIEDVLATIGVGEGEELRESSKRETTLEKFAQLRSRNPHASLTLKDTHTAFVEVDEEEESFKDITVPTRKFEQHVTDLPEKYFDYLIQRGMTNHEIGHILYSSWPALERYMDKVENEEQISSEQYRLLFKHFVNVLEDGAIEKFLRDNYRVNEEILALRSTIHEEHYMGMSTTKPTTDVTIVGDLAATEDELKEQGLMQYHYPFFQAVMAALLNEGVYDNGELDKLLDEDNDMHIFARQGGENDREMLVNHVLPKIREYIPKIQSERDAEKRMQLCYELWDFVRDYVDRSTTPGKKKYEKDDSERDEDDSYAPGVPSNLSESHGEQQTEPISADVSEDESPGREQKQELEEAVSGDGNELEEKGREGIASEATNTDGDWSEEIEEIINALGAGDGIDKLAIAEPEEVEISRKKKAKRYSKRTKRIFKRKLKQLRKDTVVHRRERGSFDTNRMIAGERGSTKIFKQQKEGTKKNYSCMIVADRSGSMRHRIDEVEIAAGAVAYGLEENGVDTSILDTYDSMTTLAKPFGSPVDEHVGTIFGHRSGGGTPLSSTVNFARQRMNRGRGDYPFMIIITDGRPRPKDEFKGEVQKANFPVLGLYLTSGRGSVEEQLKLYDRAVTVTSDDDVNQKLIDMIKGAVL